MELMSRTIKGLGISIDNINLLSKVCDNVSDEVALFLQLVIRHHWHHFVVVLG